MPLFPSKEWCDAMVRLLNADPESVRAGEGWTGDFGVVVEAEAGVLLADFTVYICPVKGRIDRCEVLRDADELEELEPAYLARAPYSTWKGLLRGTVDPVEAVLKRQIRLTGDLQPLMERMRYKGLAERVMSQLETTFMDPR